MKKILVAAALMFAVAAPALADSNVTATAHGSSSISPSGSVLVLTSASQSFNISGAVRVEVDGVNQTNLNSVNIIGDAFDHSINSYGDPGGNMLYCSSPMAPGWNVSLPDGGCPPKAAPVYLPTETIHNADGSYTFRIAQPVTSFSL